MAYSPRVGLHAVLIAQTSHGDFVLDNLHGEPRRPESLDYRWVSRQAGPSMTQWASARMERPLDIQADPNLLRTERDYDADEGEQTVALLSTVIKPSS